jgi:predicted esterase
MPRETPHPPAVAAADPHSAQAVLAAGAPLAQAKGVVLMLHGRGASAADILGLSDHLIFHGLTFLAPQAAGSTWYPNRFLDPLESNQPWLDSALKVIADLASQAAAAGIPTERTCLLGFSQGACLALEFAARSGLRWGGVFGLSGALIGPPGAPRSYPAGSRGTPVLLGCSDPDPHIPRESVSESARLLEGLGMRVDLRLYPDLGHTVNLDEIDAIRAVLEQVLDG